MFINNKYNVNPIYKYEYVQNKRLNNLKNLKKALIQTLKVCLKFVKIF